VRELPPRVNHQTIQQVPGSGVLHCTSNHPSTAIPIGNREGALWISKWNAPGFPTEQWERNEIKGKAPWLGSFQYQGGKSAPTLWLPPWLILATYMLPWAALIPWRHRRRIKSLPAGIPT